MAALRCLLSYCPICNKIFSGEGAEKEVIRCANVVKLGIRAAKWIKAGKSKPN